MKFTCTKESANAYLFTNNSFFYLMIHFRIKIYLNFMRWLDMVSKANDMLFIHVHCANAKKALRKHSLHGKIAVSVLLKLFISGNEWCHTILLTPSGTLFSNANSIIVMTIMLRHTCVMPNQRYLFKLTEQTWENSVVV